MSPEQLNILLDKECDKAFKSVRNPINNKYAEYSREVQKLISSFHIDLDGKYNPKDAMHKYLLNKLNKDINALTDDLFTFIEEKFDETIDKHYDSCYNITEHAINAKPMDSLVKSALKNTDIETEWSGIHYRDRLQNHKERLKFTIKSNLNSSISREETFRKNYATVHTSINHQLNALDRLFKTEIGVFRIQSQLSCYKVNDIMYIKNKTGGCHSVCSKHVGKKIRVKDAVVGKNIPKFHPNCKCYIQEVREEDN